MPIIRRPRASADERTRGSWAKTVESYEAIPEFYQEFYEPLIKERRACPYTVLTPSYEGFIHRTSEKLVLSCEKLQLLQKCLASAPGW